MPRAAVTGRPTLPEFATPQLATLADAPPTGDDWLHETKFDGYRIVCRVGEGDVRLLSRNGKDWTARFAPIAAARALAARTALLDGEVAVTLANGVTSFSALQNAGDGAGALVYYVFDLLHLDGTDVSALPLEERKRMLRRLIPRKGRRLRYSDHVVGSGEAVFANACRLGLEGIISKRRHAAYAGGRGRDWLKVKCVQEQELVIGGFTDPEGARTGLGALLLGVHDAHGLVYAGKVGTGFSARTAVDLRRRLDALAQKTCPFVARPAGSSRAHWVRPTLVGQVEFTEWTADGRLRHPSWKGLREDKDATAVVRERHAVRTP